MTTYLLRGIETDNLLGFMALLGLLRALEQARPNWFARASFGGLPLQALLTLSTSPTEAEIALAASEGCERFTSSFDFGPHADLNFSGSDARALLEAHQYDEPEALVLSALCSDIAVKTDGRVDPTPFCAVFGQGHQHFLKGLKGVASGAVPTKLKNAKNLVPLNAPERIQAALFERWRRTDKTELFRWDYREDRRYALRASDPSGEAPTTEHGAHRLAVLGLLSFQTAPQTKHEFAAHLETRAVTRMRHLGTKITWPIWTAPATLRAVHAMLDDPDLHRDQPHFERLSRLSVIEARRVARISVGKFVNYTAAEVLT